MQRDGKFGRQLRSWLFKASVEEEVDSEIAFHLAMRERELVARGLDPEEARRVARERMGDLPGVTRELRSLATSRDRQVRRREWWDDIVGDLTFAARQLRRSPSFTVIAALTLALGIGATTTVFSLLYAVVLRPLPFREPERVVNLGEATPGQPLSSLSAPAFVAWEESAKSFTHAAAIEYWSFNLSDDGSPERVVGARVTPEFFDVFGLRPALGRGFAPDDGVAGSDRVVVLSHGFWRERFAGDSSILGRELQLDGATFTVVGVANAGLDFQQEGERLWVPLVFTAERLAHADEHYLDAVARLSPDISIAQANTQAVPLSRDLQARHPLEYEGRTLAVAPYADSVGGPYRARLLLLLGCVGLVLLIGCANVASLLLARGAARGKEMAIRGALGAGRRRLVRQLLTEGVLLALIGGGAGAALAVVGVRAFVALAPGAVPRIQDAHVNGLALAFAFGTSLLCTLVFGLLPALRLSRLDVQAALREGGRGSRGVVHDRLRAALVTAEVALALVLLTGAGLLVRTAMAMQSVDTGFDPERLLTARVTLPRDAYRDASTLEAFFDRVTESLRGQPGIRAATVTSQSPLGRGGSGNGLLDPAKPIEPKYMVEARSRFIDPGHFKALGIRLLEGRDFTEQDLRTAPLVAILSRRAAQRLFPGESAVGKRVGCCEGSPDDPKWKAVIGVAADVTSDSLLSGDPRPVFYVPIKQIPPGAWEWIQRTMTLVVRYEGSEIDAVTAMRRAVASLDPAVPLFDVASMPVRFQRAYAQSRFNTMLLATLGLVGLVLAAVGVYGVVAYFVTQRTQEIGVRMALGATRGRVVALVTQQGMRPVLVGVVVGIAGAIATTRVLASVLYRVSPTDPLTIAAAVVLFVLVALAAAVIPARHAAAVEPTRALGQ